MRKRQGFTLIELLVVMAIIALLLGLLLPALAKARATARQVKSGTQLNQIYKGWLVWAVDNNEDSLPLPGLINRVGNQPGRGKEDLKQNTHENLYAACVTSEYFNPNIIIDPSESSGNVIANPIYDFVGNRRYKWFGRKEECWIPNEKLQQRFLDKSDFKSSS